MDFSRKSEKYKAWLKMFLEFAFSKSSCDGMTLCPCKNCGMGVCVTKMQEHKMQEVNEVTKILEYHMEQMKWMEKGKFLF